MATIKHSWFVVFSLSLSFKYTILIYFCLFVTTIIIENSCISSNSMENWGSISKSPKRKAGAQCVAEGHRGLISYVWVRMAWRVGAIHERALPRFATVQTSNSFYAPLELTTTVAHLSEIKKCVSGTISYLTTVVYLITWNGSLDRSRKCKAFMYKFQDG